MSENTPHEQSGAIGPLHCGEVRLAFDGESRIVSATDEYCALTGYCASDLLAAPLCGKVCSIVFEDDLRRFETEMGEIAAGKRFCIRYRIRKKDGFLAWHLACVTALTVVEGAVVGDVLVFDITVPTVLPGETDPGDATAPSDAKALPRMLNVIVTEHDFETQIMNIPDQEGLCSLGRKSIEPMSCDEFIASGLLHPASIADYRAFLERLETEDAADVTVRYRVATEAYHWIHLDACVVKRVGGHARRRIGLIRFIDGPPADELSRDDGKAGSPSGLGSGVHSRGTVGENSSRSFRTTWRSFLHSRKSLLFTAAIFLATCLVVIGIFLNYSNTLRHEFYQMSIEGMNDYTAAQKVEVESSIHEIKTTIATMAILAETPTIDPSGEAFGQYLAGWNEKQAFQIDYVSLEQLRASLLGPNALPSDADTLERIEQGENIISEVRHSDRLQGYYYSVAEPIVKNGQVVGALRSVVDAAGLLETSQESSQVSLVSASLIKGDGTLILTNDGEGQSSGSLYEALRAAGMSEETVSSTRAVVENDDTVATIMLGEREGRMFFLTAIRLNCNDWNIVNITEESGLAQHSDAVLKNTFVTGVVLMVITIGAALLVFFFFNRMSQKISYETDRYNVLSEFTDTVLFEYSYKTDTLTLTPNARNIFLLSDLRKERYLKEDLPLVAIHPDDYHLVKNLLEHPAASGEMNEIIYRAQVLSGDYRWFSCQCRYVYEGLEVYTAVGKIVDIDEQKAYENRLVEQAQLDGLTKLYNKGAAELRIDEALTRGTPGFLFMMDVDDFKFINDEYGHAMGDRVLAQVGRALMTVFRQGDPTGRTGGDEFIAYLSDTDRLEVAEEKARLLSSYLDKVSLDLKVPLSLSIGIACFPADGTTYKELFKAADAQMYDKKSRVKKRTRR
ncbi:MAG: diguanylate cyclase [Raoultibacter sp.]